MHVVWWCCGGEACGLLPAIASGMAAVDDDVVHVVEVVVRTFCSACEWCACVCGASSESTSSIVSRMLLLLLCVVPLVGCWRCCSLGGVVVVGGSLRRKKKG